MSSVVKSARHKFLDIYETARTSIGLPLPLEAPAIRMFRMVIAEARSLIRHRNEIETQADELLRHSKDYLLLRQIPGIGPINALTIIAEAGDLRRFHHHRQFLKFCGLDLSTQQSGHIEARPAFPSSAMRDCAAPCGSPDRSPSVSARTDSGTSSNATSREIATIPICAARR
jgi:transposase